MKTTLVLIVHDICKTRKLNVSNKSISKTMKNQISPNNFILYASIFGESIFVIVMMKKNIGI